jgi:hypothetical protein
MVSREQVDSERRHAMTAQAELLLFSMCGAGGFIKHI